MNDRVTERSMIGTHFFYVALILTMALVLVATLRWTALVGFTEYLSVAATITSLVLGILAIIYGFVSNGSINQSLGSVETASLRMGQVAADFQSIAASSQTLQERAEQRTEKLHELIGDLRAGLQDLAETTTQIHGSVDAISDRISNAQKAVPNEPEIIESQGDVASDEAEDPHARFVRRISAMGLAVLYACLHAKRAGRYVDVMKLVGPSNYEYAWGFLFASDAAGLVTLEYPSNKRQVRAVRLKDPFDQTSRAIDLAWSTSEASEKETRRRLVARYTGRIQDSLVDSTPAVEE